MCINAACTRSVVAGRPIQEIEPPACILRRSFEESFCESPATIEVQVTPAARRPAEKAPDAIEVAGFALLYVYTYAGSPTDDVRRARQQPRPGVG